MPTVAVKAVGAVAAKWKRRAASAGQEYTEGVTGTPRSWQAASTAAEGSYKQGVTEAANRGAYGQGVARKGDAGWKKATLDKGPMRFSQGVDLAEGDYSSRVQPYLDAIGRVDLPAAGPRGAAGNYARVQRIGEALRKLKTGGR